MPRQRIWVAWGIASLVWLLVSAVVVGAELGVPDYGTSSSQPAPLLSRTGCSRVADDQSAQACRGIAGIAHRRRTMEHQAELRGSLAAGTIIVGPPLVGMLIAWAAGRTSDRRAAGPRAPTIAARH